MSDSTDVSAPRRGFTGEDLLRWERVRQRLRAELGDAIYDSWFTGLELERVDGDGVQLTTGCGFSRSREFVCKRCSYGLFNDTTGCGFFVSASWKSRSRK